VFLKCRLLVVLTDGKEIANKWTADLHPARQCLVNTYCALSAGDAERETTLKAGTRRTAVFDAKKTEEAARNSIER
jgi:hypothetical protein